MDGKGTAARGRLTAPVDPRSEIAIGSEDDPGASYIEGYVRWRRKLGSANKIVSTSVRQCVLKAVLRLHFGNLTGNPDHGATVERVAGLIGSRRAEPVCGLRVLRTTLALAQRAGFLVVQNGHYDRRLKTLCPTERWIACEAERHEIALSRLSCGAPPGTNLVARLAIASVSAEGAIGLALGDPDGALGELAAIEGGFPVACAVADDWIRRRPNLSHKRMGEDFRISGSQVRKIIHLAAELGLLRLDGDGRIVDARALAAACRRLALHELALYVRWLGAGEAQRCASGRLSALLCEAD